MEPQTETPERVEPPRPPAFPDETGAPASRDEADRLVVLNGYLTRVRRGQRLRLLIAGVLWAVAALVACGGLAGLVASPSLGRSLAVAGLIAAALLVVIFGAFLPLRVVGDRHRTARFVGRRRPDASLGLLSAVELERHLAQPSAKHRDDEGPDAFSSELASAEMERLDLWAAGLDLRGVLDARPVRDAAIGLLVACLAIGTAVAIRGPSRWLSGATALFVAPAERERTLPREPITGEVSLAYRYPSHTGLPPRRVEGTSGAISAPVGTEVSLATRADRPVQRAVMLVGGERLPLEVEGERDLSGRLVVGEASSYSFAFTDSRGEVLARGPDIPIEARQDAAPEVALRAPPDRTEIDPGDEVEVHYEASDDYGLSALALVYRLPGRPDEERIPLRRDDDRRTVGRYVWRIDPSKVRPGDEIPVRVEALDNDSVAGPKRGASPTRTIKIYSAAEHRRKALEAANALWEKMLDHLADRMEGPDRERPLQPDRVVAQTGVDINGRELVERMRTTARELFDSRDAPEELAGALSTTAEALDPRVRATTVARRRYAGYLQMDAPDALAAQRLTAAVVEELAELRRGILYLESLLDRTRLEALRELGREMAARRQDLTRLLEEYQKTESPELRETVREEIAALRQQMEELSRRMAEMARGIRDEHLNADALDEMLAERDLSGMLDEVESLMREGKVDEALKALQSLGMKMDEMMAGLDRAESELGQEQFPELTEKFGELMETLSEVEQAQQELSRETQGMRERYRERVREQLRERAEAMREGLLDRTRALAERYETAPPANLGAGPESALEQTKERLANLERSIEVDDLDLAAEIAREVEQTGEELASAAERQQQIDRIMQQPAEVQAASEELAKSLRQSAEEGSELREALESLFPDPARSMTPGDRRRLAELEQRQSELSEQAREMRGSMDEMQKLAPIFGEEAMQQMQSVSERMGEAASELGRSDPRQGGAAQRQAMDQMERFRRSLAQQGKRGGGGIPLPMPSGARRMGQQRQEKVELPDEDAYRAPHELRKDLLEAMKQEAPERYREQVKRYYEELVK